MRMMLNDTVQLLPVGGNTTGASYPRPTPPPPPLTRDSVIHLTIKDHN